VAQLLATQIGSAIAMRDPQENRMLVVGTGLQEAELGREEFMGLVDLALEAL
jgi:proteasome assembly chaperone 3